MLIRTRFYVLLLALIPIGSTYACDTFCLNCSITELEPHITGSMVVSFDKRSGENSDNCGSIGKVIIDVNDVGADLMISSMLNAFLAGKEFLAVRTCGCKEEWGGGTA